MEPALMCFSVRFFHRRHRFYRDYFLHLVQLVTYQRQNVIDHVNSAKSKHPEWTGKKSHV